MTELCPPQCHHITCHIDIHEKYFDKHHEQRSYEQNVSQVTNRLAWAAALAIRTHSPKIHNQTV
jgi:hypothetical protein